MKIYKKLFSYVPDKMIYGWTAILFSIISVFMTVYGYFYIYRFLQELIVFRNGNIAQNYAIKTSILLTLGALLYMLSGLFSHILGFRLETNLRKRGIEGLTKASFRFFDLNSSGYIRKTIDDNATKTHMSVAHLIPDNAQAVAAPLLSIILGFIIDFKVGIILLVMLILGFYLLKKMMGNNEFIKIYQDSLASLSSETVEYVRGIQVIKIFGAKVISFKGLHQAINNYAKYAYEYSLSGRKPYVLFQWAFFGVISMVIIPLVFFMNSFDSTSVIVVEIIMLLFLSGVIFVSFMRVMFVAMYMFEAGYAVDTLETLYQDMKKDQLVYGYETTLENYQIEFEKISFGYREKKILENFSLTLEEGKSYALVGGSGSGKSTIAKLISGFYNVDQGQIKIGGHPLTYYTKETIINTIGFVFQDAKLFNQTIYDNVSVANPNASYDDVIRALKLAGCESILAKFPDREQTKIGAKGVYLSGGEKQRLAIARAILKDAKIVIMDEASASIDPDNEYELQKAFQNLMQTKTVIMIAHRLSSIKSVDEIIVLSQGKIIEKGSHEELLRKDQLYKKIVNQYNEANNWRVGDEGVL
ncbi:ABC transporter ATP-binding protein [Enterococcus sp. DIV1420a]|uniref:ABC transporter ATP-binding protein n=1 Tax=Enterococcus sp. DIV1420a TaxID=2774672 RepID=UPI003F2035DC